MAERLVHTPVSLSHTHTRTHTARGAHTHTHTHTSYFIFIFRNMTFALNKFADMTLKEFKEKILLPYRSPPPPSTFPPSQVAPLTPSDPPGKGRGRRDG